MTEDRGGGWVSFLRWQATPKDQATVTESLLCVNPLKTSNQAPPRPSTVGKRGVGLAASPRLRGIRPFVLRTSRITTGHPRLCGEHSLSTARAFTAPPPQSAPDSDRGVQPRCCSKQTRQRPVAVVGGTRVRHGGASLWAVLLVGWRRPAPDG